MKLNTFCPCKWHLAGLLPAAKECGPPCSCSAVPCLGQLHCAVDCQPNARNKPAPALCSSRCPSSAPGKEHLYDLEAEMGISGQILYCLYEVS